MISRNTLTVFLYELKRNLRRKAYLFMTFGVPLLGMVLLLGYQFISSRNVDEGGSASSPTDAIISEFVPDQSSKRGFVDLAGVIDRESVDTWPILVGYDDEESARAALEAGEVTLYYLVAEDYMETGDVTIVMPRIDLSSMDDSAMTNALLSSVSQQVEGDVFYRLLDPSNYQEYNLALNTVEDAPQPQNEDTAFLVVYVFALLLMLGLFTTNGYLMQSVIEEKENRVVEILLSTLRPSQLLVGKIIAMGLLGLLQIVVWIGAILLLIQIAGGSGLADTIAVIGTIANIRIPTDALPLLILYYVLAYLLFASFYGIIGAISNSMREGPQYAVFLTLPAVVPLYFLSLFVTDPNGTIPTVLSIFPLTAPVAMTQRLVIAQVPGIEIVVSLLLLAVTAVFFMWMAGRVFRVQTLLAGQMPKLRDLPRLLRG